MIYLHIPGLPLSSNKAYFTGREKVRAITKEGKAYKLEATTHLARHYPEELRYIRPNVPYAVAVHLVFSDPKALFNEGYPEKTKSRYKKLDATNRVKLLEDALSDATGCDDSQNFVWAVSKAYGPEDDTNLWLWNIEDEPHNPLCAVFTSLLAQRSAARSG